MLKAFRRRKVVLVPDRDRDELCDVNKPVVPKDFTSDLGGVIDRFRLGGYMRHTCYFSQAAVRRGDLDGEVYSVIWSDPAIASRFRVVVLNLDNFPYRVEDCLDVPKLRIA